ncbi:MAG: type I-U CRISPR-associated protein Csb2 [Gemmataceae bacterium]
MFALEVEYLTGRAVATARHAREEAEWPPHPSRLFSALVDAAFQHTSDDGVDLPGPVRDALEWLESLEPHPAIAATDAEFRKAVGTFVPTNDDNRQEKVVKEKRTIYPVISDGIGVRRVRAERRFPTAIPDSPIVHFIWRESPGAERHRAVLEALASEVTYLGHSSSLVRVAVTDEPGPATYEPHPGGRHSIRVPTRGRLCELESLFRRSARPSPGVSVTYRKIAEQEPTPTATVDGRAFGDIVVCELDRSGPFLPLSGSVKLLRAVRGALIRATDADTPAVKSLVSGHAAGFEPSQEEHVAYIPLANVGFPYSDGRVMGFGVVLPRQLDRFSEERRAVMRAVAGLRSIHIEGGHEWNVAMPTDDVPKSLQTGAYSGPAKTWATVTPVLCDRYPKQRDGERVEDIIADSVERVVGARPVVSLIRSGKHPFRVQAETEPASDREALKAGVFSPLTGVPPSHTFPNRRKEGDQPRHRVHAMLEFEQPVRGPIIACAGRYFGLGLFRVWTPEGRR